MKSITFFVRICVVAICIFSLSITCYANTFSEQEELIRNEVLAEYENDPQFILMRENNILNAENYINMLVEKRMSQLISVTSISPYLDYTYCYVTHITQSTTSNCSAATLLQTLYALGQAGTVYGTTDAQKQTTLYNKTSDDPAGARQEDQTGPLYVYEITNYLNTKVTSYIYEYEQGSNLSLSDFKSKIWDSLLFNRPVLLHARTAPLSYYNSTDLAHYLSLDSYNRNTGKVRIVDCNYNTNYGGVHTDIDAESAWKTVHDYSGRYIISY